jgi:hypothetical protein
MTIAAMAVESTTVAAMTESCLFPSPPTTRCTAERAQPEADDAAEHGSKIRKFMGDAHERARQTNRR